MSCRNWECGVVIRVPGAKGVQAGAGTREGASSAAAAGSSDLRAMYTNMDVFEGTIPVPMQFPGRRYRETEEPWFYAPT